MKKEKAVKVEKKITQNLTGLTLLKKNHSDYPTEPSIKILEAFPNSHQKNDYWITVKCPEFTSLCPVTNQPDFGEITIKYRPDGKCVESKALKLYLFSFRNHNAFHESVTNIILDDLVKLLQPREMIVCGDFRPRGGISLHIEARFVNKK